MIYRLAIVAAISFCFACGSEPENKSSADEILRASEPGDFRGVNMGDKPGDVLRKEGKDYVYSLPDELTYRIPLSRQDSTWYEITYNFSEDGLYDISLEIFPRSDSQRTRLTADFSKLYIERYGQPLIDGHYSEWKVMTAKNGRIVKIIMTDSLEKNGLPCIKLNFNEYNR